MTAFTRLFERRLAASLKASFSCFEPRRYSVQTVGEFDAAVQAGRFHEPESFEDYFRFDYLEASANPCAICSDSCDGHAG